jgi:hypothetical protein
MPIDILCKQSTSATFSATHRVNGTYKSFVSNAPPLTRADYLHLKPDGFSNSAGTVRVGYSTPDVIFGAFDRPGYRLLVAANQFGYPIQIYLNGGSIGEFTNFQADVNDPFNAPIFGLGDVVTASCPTCPAFTNSMIFRLMAYGDAWGHRVTDQAGQTEIFLSGSSTKPAPFTSSCGGQCPPGQIRCGDCCLDCKSIAGQIAAIGARL